MKCDVLIFLLQAITRDYAFNAAEEMKVNGSTLRKYRVYEIKKNDTYIKNDERKTESIPREWQWTFFL